MSRLIDPIALKQSLAVSAILEDGQHIFDIIDAQPTIEPTPQWIPCTERMPKEKDAGILKKLGTNKRSDYVIATVEVNGERMTETACTYDGVWHWDKKYAFPDYRVVAWMPLPGPYEEGEQDG